MRKFILALGVAAVAMTGLTASKCGDVNLGEPKEEAPVEQPAE